MPTPKPVDVVQLGPGERADAIVEMNRPGIWILGATRDDAREAGMGVVVEYANQHTDTQWQPPPKGFWDYTIFGTRGNASGARSDHRHGHRENSRRAARHESLDDQREGISAR